MRSGGRKFSRNQAIISVLAVMAVLWIGGCGDFFAEEPIEIQTERILNEVRQIKENPNVKNPLPDMYRGPAKSKPVDY